jgi:hypothetical protein
VGKLCHVHIPQGGEKPGENAEGGKILVCLQHSAQVCHPLQQRGVPVRQRQVVLLGQIKPRNFFLQLLQLHAQHADQDKVGGCSFGGIVLGLQCVPAHYEVTALASVRHLIEQGSTL